MGKWKDGNAAPRWLAANAGPAGQQYLNRQAVEKTAAESVSMVELLRTIVQQNGRMIEQNDLIIAHLSGPPRSPTA